jgi:hypothetical protein
MGCILREMQTCAEKPYHRRKFTVKEGETGNFFTVDRKGRDVDDARGAHVCTRCVVLSVIRMIR